MPHAAPEKKTWSRATYTRLDVIKAHEAFIAGEIEKFEQFGLYYGLGQFRLADTETWH